MNELHGGFVAAHSHHPRRSTSAHGVLTREQSAKLDRFAALLRASPHNLVSRGDRAVVREVHVEEAVALAAALPLRDRVRWIDVGTGGGLPGLPLAIVAPATHWTLVESVRKKADAVRQVAADLGLENVTVVAERAETLARDREHRETYDGAISRALARLDVAAELSRGFVRSGGLVAAVKGPAWSEERPALEAVADRLGLTAIHGAEVPHTPRPTWLVTMRATGSAPERYPRRDGVPRAKPLGDSAD